MERISVDNFDKKFTLPRCKIKWNLQDGIGATGNTRKIRTLGFVVEMKPNTFLDLAEDFYDGPTEESLDYITDYIRHGAYIAPPQLFVDVRSLQVDRHDGRHRSLVASSICPKANIPVCVIPSDESIITERLISKIRDGLYEEYTPPGEDAIWVNGPLFNVAYTNDGILKWK